MTDDRLTLALPVDVARSFDATVTDAQIDADTFQESSDDADLLTSYIEGAEDEFRTRTNEDMRVGRVGVAGTRETYEQVTYKLSGHKAYRQSFSHYTFDYDYDEVTIRLDNDRVLPFDSAEGDELYVYNGLGDRSWEDITDDEGELWTILNHVDGVLAVHPIELHRAMTSRFGGLPRGQQRLQKLRMAVSYRYGGLGGSRARTAQTALDASLTASQTGTVAVNNGTRLPSDGTGGNIVFKIGSEYVAVTPNPGTDSLDIVARGVRGTTAASHSTNDSVVYTPPAIRKAVAARAGMQLITGGQYRGFLPDMEAELDEGDIMDALSETYETTVEALS